MVIRLCQSRDVLRLRTSLGVQSLHALSPALPVRLGDRLGFAFATVPEDVGSGDVLGFADWAGHRMTENPACCAAAFHLAESALRIAFAFSPLLWAIVQSAIAQVKLRALSKRTVLETVSVIIAK